MHQKLFIALVSGLCLCRPASAQTNAPADFQGFRPGDIVQVQVRKPLIVLGQAMFQSQTSTNLVFLSRGDRYVLKKSEVELSLPRNLARLGTTATAAATSAQTSSSVAGAGVGTQDAQLLMLGVQQKILGNYANDPGYGEATKSYQQTMGKYLGGQMSLSDIVGQAERVLEQVDKYQPERDKDPQDESQIRYLKDFVQRAKNGETEQRTGKVE